MWEASAKSKKIGVCNLYAETSGYTLHIFLQYRITKHTVCLTFTFQTNGT